MVEMTKQVAEGRTVGQAAELAGVTVRTLHHYDEIGLLKPSGRTPSGYRRYSADDLDRLSRILFYRELGFSLEDIAALLDDPAVSAVGHLRRQRRLLGERIARLERMAAAVDRELEARGMGVDLTPEEKLEIFGAEYAEREAEYREEARNRWGETEAWRQSQRRAAGYTKEDWQRIKSETDEIERRLAEAVRGGVAPDSPEGMAVAEAHRAHMGRWFYDCPYAMHRGLAEMYLSDPRFTEYYERRAAGAAQWIRDAILANAAAHGED
ncbi:MerR family transcriptional regulator [Phaeacidiphilus oryzae]|uniref:MerR family transcriptional regulator n=1 Tax=Phaeacidiphilus oryzae TaxID=348818 RepID=UPI001F1E9EFE|nr:MerR family transcriptional regulator [Phaeacidiphilus oryzae]